MEWRLTLDTPYTFATEQGFTRATHCSDFRAEKGAYNDTWRDPVTNLLMLSPKFIERNYYEDFRQLTEFRTAPSLWQSVKRSTDLTAMYTMSKPANKVPGDIEVAIGVIIAAINSSAPDKDTMVWAAESNFSLEHDEGFGFHYNGISDSIGRKNNWFYMHWDRIGIHFSTQGKMRVYEYTSSLAGSSASLIHEYQFALSGEVLDKDGFFWFIPIPTVGLLVYHGYNSTSNHLAISNTGSASVRGHLIPYTTHISANGTPHLFERSQWRLGVNPNIVLQWGFQKLRFKNPGTYLDAIFDPEYLPSGDPVENAPIVLPGIESLGVTSQLRKADNSGAWVHAVDRQARMLLSLATNDTKYTPFVGGYGVIWDPVLNTRDTTPVVLHTKSGEGKDKLLDFEYTEDEFARFEGTANLLLESAAAQKIAERDDCTFTLEYRVDELSPWVIKAAGFAKDFDNEIVFDYSGFYYRTKVTLRDFFERFRETHKHFRVQTAFDGVSVGESLNNVFRGGGFSPISMPSALLAKKLPDPPDPSKWRYAPREGDKLEDLIATLLLFMRRQNVEWRLRWDYTTMGWVPEQKPRDLSDANTWLFKCFRSQENPASRILSWGDGARLQPESPEANSVIAEGMTRNDPMAERILSPPIRNLASLYDSTSSDFLGREKALTGKFFPLTSQEDVNFFARILYDATGHRRLKAERVSVPKFDSNLKPMNRIKLYRPNGSLYATFWLKRLTVTVDMNNKETMIMALDDRYESDPTK